MMRMVVDRRSAIIGIWLSSTRALGQAHLSDDNFNLEVNQKLAEEWIDHLLKSNKTTAGVLNLGRFADPMYFTLRPIGWAPNVTSQANYPPVTVPSGFVTDLASIPRVFWSALRPDGLYAYAAILHDFLYWNQEYSKEVADGILDQCMREFNVDLLTRVAIYDAVKLFGMSAWNANKAARDAGESRILDLFPTDPRTTWVEWKRDVSHFRSVE